jgi:hypothetical protein
VAVKIGEPNWVVGTGLEARSLAGGMNATFV